VALLEVRDLHTSFFTPAGEVKAVNGVSFNLERRKVLGIVGESGSGKSVTAYSVMQILESTGKIVSGSVKFDGQELVGAGERAMKKIRGNRISIIFQDPMTSLNPTYTIGRQLMEAILLHTNRNRRQARERAVEMLRLVNINEPEKRMRQYPFEFSGGMRQRIMIAMALACEPDILIADEPTTALDVTIQAQILELMKSLQEELGMAIIMITHDLGVVAQLCDEVIVMYAGSICEQGTADEIFYNPKHEYTKGLLRSIPTADTAGRRLKPISGTPIDLLNMPKGCPFAPRCDNAMKICLRERCERTRINEDHQAACWMNKKPSLTLDSVGRADGPSLTDGPGAGVMFPGPFAADLLETPDRETPRTRGRVVPMPGDVPADVNNSGAELPAPGAGQAPGADSTESMNNTSQTDSGLNHAEGGGGDD